MVVVCGGGVVVVAVVLVEAQAQPVKMRQRALSALLAGAVPFQGFIRSAMTPMYGGRAVGRAPSG